MARVAASGTRWLRVDVPFSGQMDELGRFWWHADAQITAARAHGIEVNALITSAPVWARNPDGTPNIAKFVAFVQGAVAHYAPLGVHTYEILNEPNLAYYFGTTPNPEYYAQLLKAVYPAIKALDPQAVVLTGGLAPAATTADGTRMEPMAFLTRMYAAGAQGSFDALAHHPYTGANVPTQPDSWNPWTYMPQMRQLMVAQGDGAKQIWMTEYGAATTGAGAVPETQQALMIAQAFAMAADWEWAGPIFLFNWQDSADGSFGLHRADGTPKAAVATVTQVSQGQA